MKKCTVRKFAFTAVLMLCVFLSGCGCGEKKKDPAGEQVLKITITPEPSPTVKPEEIDQNAVVTNDGVTMVNEYLISQEGAGEE